MVRSIIMLAACAALFSGCNGSTASAGPRGWNHAADGSWTAPGSQREEFTATSSPYDGTLKDLASVTTTNIVLHYKAKLVSAEPFPPCPAFAGLQIFALPGGRLAKVAFAVQNGRRVQAQYIRPNPAPDNQAAMDALAAHVCALP